MEFKGFDISHYQGNPDFGKAKAAGNDFVFIKATEGNAYKYVSHFQSNAPVAASSGLHVGAYHFGRFSTVPEAIVEAQYFYSVVKDHKLDYPVVLDLEVNDSKVSVKQLTDSAVAFLEFLENKGYFVMLYTYEDFLKTQLDSSRLTPYAWWIASYGSEPSNRHDIWQHADNGCVYAGLECDVNISYRDFAAEIASKSTFPYMVKAGENLTRIAAFNHVSVQQILAANPGIKNPNLIFPGQVLKIPK